VVWARDYYREAIIRELEIAGRNASAADSLEDYFDRLHPSADPTDSEELSVPLSAPATPSGRSSCTSRPIPNSSLSALPAQSERTGCSSAERLPPVPYSVSRTAHRALETVFDSSSLRTDRPMTSPSRLDETRCHPWVTFAQTLKKSVSVGSTPPSIHGVSSTLVFNSGPGAASEPGMANSPEQVPNPFILGGSSNTHFSNNNQSAGGHVFRPTDASSSESQGASGQFLVSFRKQPVELAGARDRSDSPRHGSSNTTPSTGHKQPYCISIDDRDDSSTRKAGSEDKGSRSILEEVDAPEGDSDTKYSGSLSGHVNSDRSHEDNEYRDQLSMSDEERGMHDEEPSSSESALPDSDDPADADYIPSENEESTDSHASYGDRDEDWGPLDEDSDEAADSVSIQLNVTRRSSIDSTRVIDILNRGYPDFDHVVSHAPGGFYVSSTRPDVGQDSD
jgi:hypothetical protein